MPDPTEMEQALSLLAVAIIRENDPEASDEVVEERALSFMTEVAQRRASDPWNLKGLQLVMEEVTVVSRLGDTIGYGRVMQLCEQLWGERLVERGLGGGEHTVGPCATFMVPCPGEQHQEDHPDYPHCDWCCGSHRVTQRVAEAIDEAQGTQTHPPAQKTVSEAPKGQEGPSRYDVLTSDE